MHACTHTQTFVIIIIPYLYKLFFVFCCTIHSLPTTNFHPSMWVCLICPLYLFSFSLCTISRLGKYVYREYNHIHTLSRILYEWWQENLFRFKWLSRLKSFMSFIYFLPAASCYLNHLLQLKYLKEAD